MSITIFHNPNCSTSRDVLATIRASGEQVEVVEYMKAGWTRAQLIALFKASKLTPRQALRTKGDLVLELGLLDPDLDDPLILEAMVAHPILVERPFVRTSKGAALCRPSHKVLGLLQHPPPGVIKA